MNQPFPPKVRNLRVIRIDDRAISPILRDKYFPTEGDGVVRRPLDLVTYPVREKIGLAINGLEAAKMFWLQFAATSIPDIVLGDIDFEHDQGSPLQDWGNEPQSHIPNGLMHCKPFAAIARATGQPLSVMLHTADAGLWKSLLSPVAAREDRKRVFMLLAAQEAMEIAAILGDAIPGAHRHNLPPVWEWLVNRTQSTPKLALEEALVGYRQQVITALRSEGLSDRIQLRVSAREWRRLIVWCQQMRTERRPLKDEVDIGLALLYPDGRTDRISFASLFADVRDVYTKALPPSCFELVKVEQPWALSRGLPQIGALIVECGKIGAVTIEAEKALRNLPLSDEPLTTNLRKIQEDPLAMGFTVLFRVLEICKSDDDRWERIWREGHWHPGKLTEVEDVNEYGWARPVSEWVKLAEEAIRAAALEGNDELVTGEQFVDVDAVREAFIAISNLPPAALQDLTAARVTRHLEFLCEIGRAETKTGPNGMVYRVRTDQDLNDKERRPSRPAAGTTGLTWQSDSLPVALRDSLGFGSRGPGINDNALGQILHDAFVGGVDDASPNANERAKSGRDFLDSFRNGDAAAWIKETCRSYCCEVLEWTEEHHWPKCIAPPLKGSTGADHTSLKTRAVGDPKPQSAE